MPNLQDTYSDSYTETYGVPVVIWSRLVTPELKLSGRKSVVTQLDLSVTPELELPGEAEVGAGLDLTATVSQLELSGRRERRGLVEVLVSPAGLEYGDATTKRTGDVEATQPVALAIEGRRGLVLFRPPTRPRPWGPWPQAQFPRQVYQRFWSRVIPPTEGQHVWLDQDGNWHAGAPTAGQMREAVYVFEGGRTHAVDQEMADALMDAGFEVTLEGAGSTG